MLELLIGLFLYVFYTGSYIYLSLAFMFIGKKVNLKYPGIAWIPYVGPLIICYQVSRMHFWPFILFGLGVVYVIILRIFEVASIFLLSLAGLMFLVSFIFTFTWLWKTFSAVNKPGWWSLFSLLPSLSSPLILYGIIRAVSDSYFLYFFLGLGFQLVSYIFFLVLLGFAAWSKN